MGKIKDLPLYDRPREKAIKNGVGSLSDAELLAIVLQSGTKEKSALDIAMELIYQYKGIEHVFEQSFHQLCLIKGISKVKALQISCVYELFVRFLNKNQVNKKAKFTLNSNQEVIKYLYYQVKNSMQEKVFVFYLNNLNVVLFEQVLSIGSENQCVYSNKQIVKIAIEHNATKVMMVHNHPSGSAKASIEDTCAYMTLKNALSFIQVKLLDHLIIGEKQFYSVKEEQLYPIDL